ncbi:RNA-directed DNA polymerase, eukaryota, reverse transcriptase zinc-binding domain protein [Tanacetum coccineum]
MDRLPSRANLLNRGVEISCARCVLCDRENEVETMKHCLCLCPKAKLVWSKVYSWWRVNSTPGTSIHDISLGKVAPFENKWVAKCFHRVCYIVLWAIWHWRNRILHASPLDVDSVRQEDIFPSIHLYKPSVFRAPSRRPVGIAATKAAEIDVVAVPSLTKQSHL